VIAGAEALPRRPRPPYAVYANGLRKIIGAAYGNNERRDLLQHQPAKMAMDGPIAAEDQRRFRLVGGIEFVP